MATSSSAETARAATTPGFARSEMTPATARAQTVNVRARLPVRGPSRRVVCVCPNNATDQASLDSRLDLAESPPHAVTYLRPKRLPYRCISRALHPRTRRRPASRAVRRPVSYTHLRAHETPEH